MHQRISGRKRVKKNDAETSLALIEKARGGLINRVQRKIKAGKYLKERRHGGMVAAGSGGKRYAGFYEARRGKYKAR